MYSARYGGITKSLLGIDAGSLTSFPSTAKVEDIVRRSMGFLNPKTMAGERVWQRCLARNHSYIDGCMFVTRSCWVEKYYNRALPWAFCEMFEGRPSNKSESPEAIADKRAYEDSRPSLSSIYPEAIKTSV